MPLTAAEWKAFVPVRLGDTGIVAANLDLIWLMHDDKRPVELQYNYVLIEGVNLLLGGNWQEVNWVEDRLTRSDDSQRFDHLVQIAQGAQKRIDLLISARNTATGIQVGTLTARAPQPAANGRLDANSLDYEGSPNSRVWPTQG